MRVLLFLFAIAALCATLITADAKPFTYEDLLAPEFSDDPFIINMPLRLGQKRTICIEKLARAILRLQSQLYKLANITKGWDAEDDASCTDADKSSSADKPHDSQTRADDTQSPDGHGMSAFDSGLAPNVVNVPALDSGLAPNIVNVPALDSKYIERLLAARDEGDLYVPEAGEESFLNLTTGADAEPLE